MDLASHFLTDRITEQLAEVLSFASKEVGLFTVKTLALTDSPIPAERIESLAKDVSCAAVLYFSLKKANKLVFRVFLPVRLFLNIYGISYCVR